jgi:UDP-glucose:(heptosyl)LPS alpha-1,3-glucosyltransferase
MMQESSEVTISGSMHIAMVLRSFATGGGLELYTYKVVEGLLERGHKVTVICEENKTDLVHANLNYVFFAKPKAKSRKAERLKHYFDAGTACVESAGPFDLVNAQHFPIANADVFTFHNHSVAYLSHVGKGWENLVNKLKAAFIPAYRLRDQQDELMCQTAKYFVFSSKTCRDDFYYTYDISPNKPSVVAYPGSSLLDPESVNPISSKPDQEPFTFLFVGKGFRKKGLDVLFHACHLLAKQGKDFRLVIAGLKGKPQDHVRKKLLGLESQIQYLGFQKDMGKVYRQAQALILPSRVEPFGMVVLQAMQWGMPAIVSRRCGVSEVITHGKDGLILENHLDAEELANLMTELMSDPSVTETMGKRARDITAQMTWKETCEATLEAYALALYGVHRS